MVQKLFLFLFAAQESRSLVLAPVEWMGSHVQTLLRWRIKISYNCLIFTNLSKAVLESRVLRCRDSSFFSSASLTQARAYPTWVFISVIAWTFLMSKSSESGSGLSCSGPIERRSTVPAGDLWRWCGSELRVGETSVSRARFDRSA